MRERLASCLAAAAFALAQVAAAGPPLPVLQVIDTVRGLAAEEIGVKKSDIDTFTSLADQGFDETSLRSLIVSVQQEFSVVISELEIHQAKAREPNVPLSVRVIAELVVRHQRSEWQ
jgi:hypothetical protein